MPRQHMNERDKLRKFRELDDAFAQALRELDGGSRQASASPVDERPQFEERLRALMSEYALSQQCVLDMLTTLTRLKHLS